MNRTASSFAVNHFFSVTLEVNCENLPEKNVFRFLAFSLSFFIVQCNSIFSHDNSVGRSSSSDGQNLKCRRFRNFHNFSFISDFVRLW